MKKLFVFASITTMLLAVSCKKCSLDSPLIIPEQSLRIVNANGDDLVFGDSAIYDVNEIEFVHEREGSLSFSPSASSKTILLAFPQTLNQPEEISMVLDSNTTHILTYNTLVFSNNECLREYVLSYVKLDGNQVCGSCGDPSFNSDPIIYLEL